MSRYQLRRIGGPPDGAANGPVNLSIIPLDSELLKFGRNPDQVQVVLHSTYYSNMISREHAEMRRNRNTDGTTAYYVIDRSLNGTYVNENRVRGSTLLHPGDLIKFGHVNGAAIAPGQHAPQPHAEFTYIFEKVPRSTSVQQQQTPLQATAGPNYGQTQGSSYYPTGQTAPRPAGGMQNHFPSAVNHGAYGAAAAGQAHQQVAQQRLMSHGGYPAAAYANAAAAQMAYHPFLATHPAYAAAMYNNRMQAAASAGFPAAAHQFSQWPSAAALQQQTPAVGAGYAAATAGMSVASSSSCAVSAPQRPSPQLGSPVLPAHSAMQTVMKQPAATAMGISAGSTDLSAALSSAGGTIDPRNASIAENVDYALDKLFPIARSSAPSETSGANWASTVSAGISSGIAPGAGLKSAAGVIISPGLVNSSNGTAVNTVNASPNKRVMECDSSVPSPPKPVTGLAPSLDGFLAKMGDDDNGSLSQDLRELAQNAMKARALNDSPDTFLANPPAVSPDASDSTKPVPLKTDEDLGTVESANPSSVVNVETMDSPKKESESNNPSSTLSSPSTTSTTLNADQTAVNTAQQPPPASEVAAKLRERNDQNPKSTEKNVGVNSNVKKRPRDFNPAGKGKPKSVTVDKSRRKSNEVHRLLSDLTEGSWMHVAAHPSRPQKQTPKSGSRKRKSDTDKEKKKEKDTKQQTGRGKGSRSRSRASVGSEGAPLSPCNSSTSASVSSPDIPSVSSPIANTKEILSSTLSHPYSRDKDKCSPLKKRKGFRSPVSPASPKTTLLSSPNSDTSHNRTSSPEKTETAKKPPPKRGRPPLSQKKTDATAILPKARGKTKLKVQLGGGPGRKGRGRSAAAPAILNLGKSSPKGKRRGRRSKAVTAALRQAKLLTSITTNSNATKVAASSSGKKGGKRGRGRRKQPGGLTAAEEKELIEEEIALNHGLIGSDQTDTWKFHDPGSTCDLKGKCKRPQMDSVDWIGCEDCEKWFHTICADAKIPSDSDAPYFCGSCLKKSKKIKI